MLSCHTWDWIAVIPLKQGLRRPHGLTFRDFYLTPRPNSTKTRIKTYIPNLRRAGFSYTPRPNSTKTRIKTRDYPGENSRWPWLRDHLPLQQGRGIFPTQKSQNFGKREATQDKSQKHRGETRFCVFCEFCVKLPRPTSSTTRIKTRWFCRLSFLYRWTPRPSSTTTRIKTG